MTKVGDKFRTLRYKKLVDWYRSPAVVRIVKPRMLWTVGNTLRIPDKNAPRILVKWAQNLAAYYYGGSLDSAMGGEWYEPCTLDCFWYSTQQRPTKNANHVTREFPSGMVKTLLCRPEALLPVPLGSSYWFPAGTSGGQQFGNNHYICRPKSSFHLPRQPAPTPSSFLPPPPKDCHHLKPFHGFGSQLRHTLSFRTFFCMYNIQSYASLIFLIMFWIQVFWGVMSCRLTDSCLPYYVILQWVYGTHNSEGCLFLHFSLHSIYLQNHCCVITGVYVLYWGSYFGTFSCTESLLTLTRE